MDFIRGRISNDLISCRETENDKMIATYFRISTPLVTKRFKASEIGHMRSFASQ